MSALSGSRGLINGNLQEDVIILNYILPDKCWMQDRNMCSLSVSLSACNLVSSCKCHLPLMSAITATSPDSCLLLLKIFDIQLISVTQSLSVSLSSDQSCTFFLLKKRRNIQYFWGMQPCSTNEISIKYNVRSLQSLDMVILYISVVEASQNTGLFCL